MTALTGTWPLVRLILRRDRIRLPSWLLAIVGLVYASAAAVQGVYDTAAARTAYAETVGNSGASIAMAGPPTAIDTIGGITVFEVTATAVIGVALMAIFLTIRHTRADEEAGRTELLRAGVLGRLAPLAATGLVMGSASLVVGAGVAAGFLATGLESSGSLLYGASVAAVGLVFTGVALLAAQVTEHARGAGGLALTTLGVSFAIRAFGDVTESWVSWLSPIGWSQAVGAFGDEQRWWPLVLCLALTGVLAGAAVWLVSHRDVGAGLVAPRLGSAHASRRLAGPFGLATRLQRGSLIAWGAGMAVLGVAFGSLGQEVEGLLEGNPELEEVIVQQSGTSIVDAYFGTVLMISALIAAGFTVSSVLRLRQEEAAGRAEPLLATPLSRWRWALTSLAVTLLGTVAVVGVAGLTAGLAEAAASSDLGRVWPLLRGALAFLPAVLCLGTVAVALFGWLPRAAFAAWAFLAVCVVIGWLGEALTLPDWLMDASPFTQTPPLYDLAWSPLVTMALLAGAVAILGLIGLRRRDIG
jgi:ABC-2 type transport system permease protein